MKVDCICFFLVDGFVILPIPWFQSSKSARPFIGPTDRPPVIQTPVWWWYFWWLHDSSTRYAIWVSDDHRWSKVRARPVAKVMDTLIRGDAISIFDRLKKDVSLLCLMSQSLMSRNDDNATFPEATQTWSGWVTTDGVIRERVSDRPLRIEYWSS